MTEKSYRIKASVGQEQVIKTSLTQDIDFLEVLSLKLNQKDTYKLHVSNYGIIVGRVLANEAFGIPNAKVSVFIKLNDDDLENSEIANLYPYRSIMTTNNDNKRYNLLSDSSNDDCYRIVGTFPNKRLVLDNDTEIEIYDKYWKYTTVTNQSGDYMIFGVPTGNQTIHVDIDLSDIGILSQKPRDFFYKGYNKEQFDSAEQFKEGSDLDNLTQLLSQNTSVHVFPFFGDKSENDIAITRCDIQVPYKFEPTCVFIGSIISDKKGQHIGHACGPSKKVGFNSNLTTGEGTIEMIRQTPDGLIEEFPIKANRLIDGDGVWCYQIPMNLDYIGTDEFGNIIPVQDSTKGIPTRTSVRFRISMQETISAPSTEHVAKHLVPSVHELDSQTNEPHILNGSLYDNCYEFGSATPKEYFRDLLWNKVYSVKSFIPRFEHKNKSGKNYMGIRSVNDDTNNNNVFPFNSARFQLKFTYRLLCMLMSIVVDILGFYNKLISEIICLTIKIPVIHVKIRPFKFLSELIKCIGMKGGWFFEEESHIYYFPRCDKECGSIIERDGLEVNKDKNALKDRIQQALALEYDLVHLDFHNDWVNGTLYFPLWFWKKRAKKKYFFGLFSKKAVNTFCSCDKSYGALALTQGCSVTYDSSFKPINVPSESKDLHKHYEGRQVKYGVIKEFTNRDGLNVYYYAPGVPNDGNYKSNKGLTSFSQLFATDIILLGSLNSCDLDNLPKTFDSLPSTTVNLPFIATFTSDETGDGVVTGLDWGHNGQNAPVKYQEGLLIDLTCWNIYTRYKSCVNLSRLSELHVTLDMDMKVDDVNEPNIIHDGLITEKELVEHETRAKFASLNHNGLTNLVKNPTTNYDTYKFHYVYPVNFDGHLESIRTNYSISKTFSDISDSNYIMYRLGEGKDSKSNLRHKKHFYNGTENNFTFPLYNNSFYFYFGLNEGNTAIDKFNTQYNALCTKRNNFSFTIEYNAKAGKWCYNPSNVATDFGTIDIEFEGLTESFSYTLYNEFNEMLISETNVVSNDLKFGYDIKEGGKSYIMTNDGYKRDGRLKEFNTGKLVTNSFDEPIFLENGIYYLEVTNSFGMKVTQKINMIQNVLSPNFEEIRLGTKYIQGKTTASDICGEMDYYGEIRIKSFTIDGEDVYVQSIENYYLDGVDHYYIINETIVYPIDGVIDYNEVNYNETYNEEDNKWFVEISGETYESYIYEQQKEVTCKVTCSDGSQIYLILEPENDETQDISNFVCYGVGNIQSARLEQQGEVNGAEVYTLIFNIWKPGDYVLTSNQICNNLLNDNVSVNTISIENGEKFQALINDVPFNLVNNDYFKGNLIPYAEGLTSITNSIEDSFPRPWLQLENPQVYGFKGTKFNNIDFWDDFVDISSTYKVKDGETINYITSSSKIDIIKTQIKAISEMRNIAYIMGEENIPQITITTKGGKEPIIIRNIHPNYNLLDEENYISDGILVENSNSLQAPLMFPYIVDEFYQNTRDLDYGEKYKIRLNDLVYPLSANKLGNYFAVFTNNGGMVNLLNGESKYDSSLYVESVPIGAKPLTSITTAKTVKTNKYPQAIFQKGCEYFRTMFVEKRISFGGKFYLPISCKYKIHDDDDLLWKYGNFKAKIYNVAPLVYDEENNIIGDNLSYEIKHVLDEITVENIVSSSTKNNQTKVYYEINGDKYSLSFTSSSHFYGISQGFSTPNTITGKSFDDILVKIRSICDNIADNINFVYNNNTIASITFNKIVDINDASVFSDDSNIKLTSNLMWYSDLCNVSRNKSQLRLKGRLFKNLISVDDIETDVRDKFENYLYGSENYGTNQHISFSTTSGLTVPFGSTFSIESSNCKMLGELEYEVVTDEEEKEHYIFSSKVESGDVIKTSLDIGDRINVVSSSLFYEPINNGKYFVYNGQRTFLGQKDENAYKKYYVYNKNNFDSDSETIHNLYTIFNGEEIQIEQSTSDADYANCYMLSSTTKGFVWFKKTLVYTTYDEISDIIPSKGTQKYMNKFGVPIYCYYGNGYLYYTFNPYVRDEFVKLSYTSNKNNISDSLYTTVASDGYYYIYDNRETDDGNNENYIKVGSYINFVFKIKLDDKYVNAVIPIPRQEYLTIVESNNTTNATLTNYSGYFYKTIEQNNNDKSTLISETCKLIYSDDDKVTSVEIEEGNTYKVTTYIKKEWLQPYVVMYYYFPINFNSEKNPYINTKNLFNVNDVYDGKKIGLQVYKNVDNVASFVEYVFEKNELNNRFYLRELDSDGNTVKYHKLQFLYRKYYSYSASNTFYYDGEEELEYQYGKVYKVDTHINNLLHVKSIRTTTPNDLDNDPHIKNDDGTNTYKSVHKVSSLFKKSGDTVEFNSELYDVRELPFTQFEISTIEDFSCNIEMDSSNEDCDSISTESPFLSYAVTKNYGLEKNNEEYVFFDEFETSMPIWSVPSNNVNLVKNVDFFENDIYNICILTEKPYVIYNDKLYDYIVYKPKHDLDGYLLNKDGEHLLDKSNNKIHWTNVIEIYYVLLGKNKILNDKTNEEISISTSKYNNDTFNNIVWNEITFSEYKTLIESKIKEDSTNIYLQQKSIKKVVIIPKEEINLTKLGDKRYYQGSFNVDNVLKENISDETKKCGNTNLPYFIPEITNENDLYLIKKYKTKSAIIGETYPYFNRFAFGSLETKTNHYGTPIKVFDFVTDEEGNKNTKFFESSNLGFEYGNYLSIFKNHPIRTTKMFSYELNGILNSKIYSYASNFNDTMGFHSFVPVVNNEKVYESNENYDKLLYVFQPNTKCDIPKGTKIISCNFAKSYGDSNVDFNYGLIETFSQSSSFHVGPMYFGTSFDVKVINQWDKFGPYSLTKKLPVYIFNDNINEDLKLAFNDNNFTYHFNGKDYTYNDDEKINGITLPQLTYYASYSNDQFTDEIGINTDGSTVNAQLFDGNKIKLLDTYGDDMYLMRFDDKKLENYNGFNSIKPIFKFNYDSKYYISLLDPYTMSTIHSIEVEKSKINDELTKIIEKYNITKLGDNKYNLYYNDIYEDDSDNEGGDSGGNEGDSGEINPPTVETYKVNIKISLYTSPTSLSSTLVELSKYLEITLIESDYVTWENIVARFSSTENPRLGVSSDYVTLIYGDTAYYLREGGRDGDKISSNSQVSISRDSSTTGNTTEYIVNVSYLSACNDEDDTPGTGGGTIIIPPITSQTPSVTSVYEESYEPSTISDETVVIDDTEEILPADDFKKHVINLSADTSNVAEIYLYDYRVNGYPIKVIKDGKSTQDTISGTITKYELNYIGFVSDLTSRDNTDIRAIEKNNIEYPYYIAFSKNSTTIMPTIDDILEIGYIKDKEIELNNNIINYYTLIIPYAAAKYSEQKLVQITCDDGYVVNGTQYEKIMCINGEGEKKEYTFNTLLNQGILGLFIYHIETINDVNYDFVSRISNIKTVGASYLLTVDCDNLVNKQNVVLSISTNNLLHKFPFHYKDGILKPGFYDKFIDYDDNINIGVGGNNSGGNGGSTTTSYKVKIPIQLNNGSTSFTTISIEVTLNKITNLTWNNIAVSFSALDSKRIGSDNGVIKYYDNNNVYSLCYLNGNTRVNIKTTDTIKFSYYGSEMGYNYNGSDIYGYK